MSQYEEDKHVNEELVQEGLGYFPERPLSQAMLDNKNQLRDHERYTAERIRAQNAGDKLITT